MFAWFWYNPPPPSLGLKNKKGVSISFFRVFYIPLSANRCALS